MQELTAAGEQLRHGLAAAEREVLQLSAAGEAARGQLQSSEGRVRELTTAVEQLTRALGDSEGRIAGLTAAGEGLESSLGEATAAWEAAEQREAEALLEVGFRVYRALRINSPFRALPVNSEAGSLRGDRSARGGGPLRSDLRLIGL